MNVTSVSSTLPLYTDELKKASLMSGGGSEFSEILNQSMQDELVQNALTSTAGAGLGVATGVDMSMENTVMGLVANASASGSVSDAEIAIMLLCMMMSMETGGSGGGGDMSPIFIAMSSMLSGLTGDTDALRTNVMNSGYSPSVLDTVDREVFGNSFTTPQVSGTGSAIVPSEAWRPTSPSVVSGASNRSAGLYRQVLDQFGVESSERYRPYRRGNDTYCNIFVWDATSAMGCEIPHFVDPDGTPRAYPDVSGAYELDANGVHNWLVNSGPEYGWREVSAEEAQAWANAGKPAVTAYNNVGGIGHVQMVCPSADGKYDPVRGVTVTQAGSSRYNYAYISSTDRKSVV